MKLQLSRGVSWLLALVVVTLGAPAGAVDGVIELNQASIMAAGGFPYTITASGIHRLTSNLTVSGNGISGASVVTNGRVRGFAVGIASSADRPIRVQGVEVTQNSSSGFQSTSASYQFLESSATVHGQYGLNGAGAVGVGIVDRSVFNRNRSYGAYVASGTVSRSTFAQNDQGVRSNNGFGCLVSDSVFERNDTGFFGNATSGFSGNLFRDQQTSHLGGAALNLGGNQCDKRVVSLALK